MVNRQQVIDYYDECEIDYRWVWNLQNSLAMHYGYWDDTTKHLSDALRRENDVLAKLAKITKRDSVLDAGCGVGGSAIFLAKHIGCHATGITLVKSQVERARENAKRFGVASLARFFQQDYTKTTFPQASFTVVWGIESVLHAEKKIDFLKEAYRLLKKGGRLVVADFFASKEKYTEQEKVLMKNWLSGWAVEEVESPKGFASAAKEAGFGKCQYTNITNNIVKSSRRLYLSSYPATVVGGFLQMVGLRTKLQNRNVSAVYYQWKALQKKLWQYGIFYAEQ